MTARDPVAPGPNRFLNFRDVNTIARELRCVICTDLFEQPVVTPCNHTFCRDCIEHHLRNSPTCPLCKAHVLRRALRDMPTVAGLVAVYQRMIGDECLSQLSQRVARRQGSPTLASPTVLNGSPLSFPTSRWQVASPAPPATSSRAPAVPSALRTPPPPPPLAPPPPPAPTAPPHTSVAPQPTQPHPAVPVDPPLHPKEVRGDSDDEKKEEEGKQQEEEEPQPVKVEESHGVGAAAEPDTQRSRRASIRSQHRESSPSDEPKNKGRRKRARSPKPAGESKARDEGDGTDAGAGRCSLCPFDHRNPSAVARYLEWLGRQPHRPHDCPTTGPQLRDFLGQLQGPFRGKKSVAEPAVHAHDGCLLWTPECYEEPGGTFHGVPQAVRRAKRTLCVLCHSRGASAKCSAPGCGWAAHVLCAFLGGTNVTKHEANLYTMQCPLHAAAVP